MIRLMWAIWSIFLFFRMYETAMWWRMKVIKGRYMREIV